MDGDYLILVYFIFVFVYGGGIIYKINATMSCTNKSSIIVQNLYLGVVPTTVGGQGLLPCLPYHMLESLQDNNYQLAVPSYDT